ncbi:hypothetical protein CLAIMM_02393 [Cladophialophora immunda]|nr:hypothetical protein CLAIMM_02393 [Cladophialophora immunda]
METFYALVKCFKLGLVSSFLLPRQNIYVVPRLEDRARYRFLKLAHPLQIRLVELFTSPEPDDTLRFKIHNADLGSSHVKYTAISYAWGKRVANEDILVECDGCRAYIPSSLHSALKRLRDRHSANQFIWADALCIDQMDDEAANIEKAAQVSLMDQIFGQAEEVVIELGGLSAEDQHVLSILDRYQAIPEATWHLCTLSDAKSNVEESIKFMQSLGLPGPKSSFWPSFRLFMNRPWYTRVWIIQEYALSKEPVFMIGKTFRDKSFLSNAVFRACDHLSLLYMHSVFYCDGIPVEHAIGEVYWYIIEKQRAIYRLCEARVCSRYGRTLCELVDGTISYFEATDTRDKVYALLGLSSDEKIKTDLYIDYNEPVEKLCLRASQYLSRRGYTIYVMYHCVGDKEGFTSWALNLNASTKGGLSRLVDPSGSMGLQLFDACGPAPFVRKFSDLSRGVLTVRGWVVDTIDSAMAHSMPVDADLSGPKDLERYSVWQGHALEWMLSVAHTQPLSQQEFTKLCWHVAISDVVVGSGQESVGRQRLRDWPHSKRCIETVDLLIRLCYAKWTGDLPESFMIEEDSTKLRDFYVYGQSFNYTFGHKLAITSKRRAPCLVPSAAKEGDVVAVVQGCRIPFVLRRKVERGQEHFRIVGCTYVHGIMDGETVEEGQKEMRDIEIW